MKIYNDITELIGRTPLVRLSHIAEGYGVKSEILAKVEKFNPAGSSKDRIGYYLIEDAEKKGKLAPGGTIIEPTSGNTGIGLAAVAALKGYRVILTMPDTMSAERIAVLKAYGAEIVMTPGELGMKGSIDKANELLFEIKGSFMPSQFDNPANPEAHYLTTGPEIWDDTDGKVDILIAGVGTGGSLCGTARYLKERNENIKVIAVEPRESQVIATGKTATHGIQGIGANFVPGNYDATLVDEVIPVSTDDAYIFTRELGRREGLLCGISSGAAVAAAVGYGISHEGKMIVTILPDTGERYISTGVFDK